MCVTPGLNDAQEKSKVPSLGHTAVEDCGYIMPKFSQCGYCISLRPGEEGGHSNQMGVSWEYCQVMINTSAASTGSLSLLAGYLAAIKVFPLLIAH